MGAQLITVGELMGRGEAAPSVGADATIAQAIAEMSAKSWYGGTAVVDASGRLIGAFTDGDLRRSVGRADPSSKVRDYMAVSPMSVGPEVVASEAMRIMNERERPIMLMFVCEDGRLVGAVHMHDFLRAGIA